MIDYAVLGTVVIFVVAPIVTMMAKRFIWAKDMAVPINGIASISMFVGVWALMDGSPETLWPVIERAMAVALGSSASIAVGRKMRNGDGR